MTQPKITAQTIEKGVFVRCGHPAIIGNAYMYNGIVICRQCKYKKDDEYKNKNLLTKGNT